MEKLIIVSSDSHAAMPSELWTEYFEKRFHEHLPQIQYESDLYSGSVVPLSKMIMGRPENTEDHFSPTGGYRGVYDCDVRLEQMDREGITAELIYHGDARSWRPGPQRDQQRLALRRVGRGVRAYNRWAHDAFGSAPDRLLLIGAIGSCSDMDATVAELRWIADNGFTGTFAPGFLTHPEMPPLFDPYWEPLWAECEAQGLAIVVHAGYGFEQGLLYERLDRVNREVKEVGGSDDGSRDAAHAGRLHPGVLLRHQGAPPDVADDVRRCVRPASQLEARNDRDPSRLDPHEPCTLGRTLRRTPV